MKKIFLLITIFFAYSLSAQTLQNPTYGNTTTNTLKIKNAPTVTSANFLTTTEADGVQGKLDPVNLPFTTNIKNSKGLISGDSTIASYLGQSAVSTFLVEPKDVLEGASITDISVPGNTITQQKTAFMALSDKNTYDYIIVQIGLNDVGYTESNAIVIARLQDYISTINAYKKSSCKVIIGTMIPARQRWISSYGNTNGIIAQAQWLALNESIMGGGTNPISNVSNRVNAHTVMLNDGFQNLASVYDMGDFIHENNDARAIIASGYRNILNDLGFLKTSKGLFSSKFEYQGLRSYKTISLPNNSAGLAFNATFFNGSGLKFTDTGYSHIINTTANTGELKISVSQNSTLGYGDTPVYTDILNLSSSGVDVVGRVRSSTGLETGFINNQRNKVWNFDIVPTVGISYFAGSTGIGGSDTFGIHFGTATAVGSKVRLIDQPGNFRVEIEGTAKAYPAVSDDQLATLGQVNALTRPYKVYTALLSQSGTSAPTSTVLENTLGGTIVWSRSGTGDYSGVLTGVFTLNKTAIFMGTQMAPSSVHSIKSMYIDANTIRILTIPASGGTADSVLSNTSIEVRVYL